MRRLISLIYRFLQAFGFDLREMFFGIRGFLVYVVDLWRFYSRNRLENKLTPSFLDLHPILSDRYKNSGVAKGHYFHQDLWAARKIYRQNPPRHIDIGSRVDGFISHLLVFREVIVIDTRLLSSNDPRLHFIQGDICNLNYEDDSVESISSLHVIEHIGLGRYGDEIDPQGWRRALDELKRILAINGRLYLSVPIGRERVCFNAHRVFSVRQIMEATRGLELLSFSYVDDAGNMHENVDFTSVDRIEYGCGLFEFTKI